MFLNHSLELWIICLIGTLVRLRSTTATTNLKGTMLVWAIVSSGIISVLSGVFLSGPIASYVGMDPATVIFVGLLVSLTAESLMAGISRWSEQFKVGAFIEDYLSSRIKK